ncbi:hypothetical protein BLNAU_10776 [Blattamonas nauphoetae]|uniref:Uncharacterized protein n=1 Tax=Blattamonas nauphoetae TaxID=2049346 RepID=A0ABQ9XPC8_9EUKA|nr:hypothetical protein BLNAU_10776 [Blattamonas nauphoetae]
MSHQPFTQTFDSYLDSLTCYKSHYYPVNVNFPSSRPPVDIEKAKQRICGDFQAIHPMMLKDLLVLVTESDWALSTIPDVDYIKPLEQYCEQAKPCDVPHCSQCALHTMQVRSRRMLLPPKTHCAFCFENKFLGAYVSQIKSIFTEPSSSHPAISAHSARLPAESLNLTENTVLVILDKEFSLISSLLYNSDLTFQNILIDFNFVRLLKSFIIISLDLLRKLKCESISPSADRSAALTRIINWSWSCAASAVYHGWDSFHPVIESTFSDIPQLCSLLERTCRHSSPNYQHLRMVINLTTHLPHFIPHMLDENLVQRIINASKPTTVPTKNGSFHLNLINTFLNLIWNFNITEDNEERKRIRKIQFERVLKPARDYLQFILQREEFIQNDGSNNLDLSTLITNLLDRTLVLERELLEDGEIVETGREEWEVGWLVEKTNEESLDTTLKKIREDDEKMKRDEKERWKKRVERHQEAGHEDVMEGWLLRLADETRSEIVGYLESVIWESGMNNSM